LLQQASTEALRKDNSRKKISKAEFRALSADDQRFSPGKRSRIAAKFDRRDATKKAARERKKDRIREKMNQAQKQRLGALAEGEIE
jgi:hypothetical protein